jgi:hypothetical protein
MASRRKPEQAACDRTCPSFPQGYPDEKEESLTTSVSGNMENRNYTVEQWRPSKSRGGRRRHDTGLESSTSTKTE